MKITNQKLKELIREEIQNLIGESLLSEAPLRMKGGQPIETYELQKEVKRLTKWLDDIRSGHLHLRKRVTALENR